VKANRGADDGNKPSEATDYNARSPDADEAPNAPAPQDNNSHQAPASSPGVDSTETSAPGGQIGANQPSLRYRNAQRGHDHGGSRRQPLVLVSRPQQS